MLLPDLQMVLDKLVSEYGNISPQILRSAVEYAKMSAGMISVEGDEFSGGKDILYVRAQAYIEGYCKVYDEYCNTKAYEVASTDLTRYAMSNIQQDFGEEAPTYFLSACGDYLIAISSDADGILEEDMSSLLLSAGIGFMDGAIDADLDIGDGAYIKPVFPPYPMSASEQAYDIIAEEVSLNIEDDGVAEEIKKLVCADLTRMMNRVIYPRSGNSEIQTEDSLACAMMYLGGYVKGILGENDTGLDIDLISPQSNSLQEALHAADALLSNWIRYRGHSETTAAESVEAMRDAVLLDNLFLSEHISTAETSMAALYGMGYSDARQSLGNDADSDDSLRYSAISDEIDIILSSCD